MAQVSFEFRFESDGLTSPEDVVNTKELFNVWVSKKLFQDSVNCGMQVTNDLNIQLISYTNDDADFEVVDGWAEPVLKYSIVKK